MIENTDKKNAEKEGSSRKPKKPSELIGEGKCSMEDVIALFDAETQAPVQLTEGEITEAKRNRREFNNQYRSFNKAPIYRTLHSVMRTLMDVTSMMPRKYVKLTDVILSYYAECIRWTASAYEQDRVQAKHISLSEAISLMYTVRVMCNSVYQIQLVGKAKSEELSKQCDMIMRQLVAWRGSLHDLGDYGNK